jgi:hypothetical protein
VVGFSLRRFHFHSPPECHRNLRASKYLTVECFATRHLAFSENEVSSANGPRAVQRCDRVGSKAVRSFDIRVWHPRALCRRMPEHLGPHSTPTHRTAGTHFLYVLSGQPITRRDNVQRRTESPWQVASPPTLPGAHVHRCCTQYSQFIIFHHRYPRFGTQSLETPKLWSRIIVDTALWNDSTISSETLLSLLSISLKRNGIIR